MQNLILLLGSLFFYAWGGVSFTAILIFSILINFLIGLQISKNLDTPKAKYWLTFGVMINLGILGFFKYANFFVENINPLLESLKIGGMSLRKVVLPLGISFFTFQAISYLVDVYRKTVPVQRHFEKLALYIAFFPQLIAGPIVRYETLAQQLDHRQRRLEDFAIGVERFIIGLAKKVLIANNVAMVGDKIFGFSSDTLTTDLAWLGILCYSLQIYFDFSGYSDMAIGLGRMFGFRIPENFNFPYAANSIRDFWRRWHISLSTWFRDYLYIPLGGSRGSEYRTYFNLFVVFLLTGFWHGASWTFIIWGLFHGFFLIIERIGFDKILKKIGPFSHVYTLLVVIIGWVFFRIDNLEKSFEYCHALFSFNGFNEEYSIKQLDKHFFTVFSLGVLFSVPCYKYVKAKWSFFQKDFTLLKSFGLTLLLVLCMLYIAADSYNPFIYFRF